MKDAPTLGFIGQGYVGKNSADDCERRGFAVVRYALEEAYRGNKEKIKECDIVFIAVPTPTTPKGSDDSIVRDALSNVKKGAIAVIRSTILPGTTRKLQEQFSELTILFVPEFLREATAAYDAAHPYSLIIGMPSKRARHRAAGNLLLKILPLAPFVHRCGSTEAELIKYAQNASGFVQILLFNLLYDLAQKLGADWDDVRIGLSGDPNVPARFANPVHKGGRGAGGRCLIKDFAALRFLYEKLVHDERGSKLLRAHEEKNRALLRESGKDTDVLRSVYGR